MSLVCEEWDHALFLAIWESKGDSKMEKQTNTVFCIHLHIWKHAIQLIHPTDGQCLFLHLIKCRTAVLRPCMHQPWEWNQNGSLLWTAPWNGQDFVSGMWVHQCGVRYGSWPNPLCFVILVRHLWSRYISHNCFWQMALIMLTFISLAQKPHTQWIIQLCANFFLLFFGSCF